MAHHYCKHDLAGIDKLAADGVEFEQLKVEHWQLLADIQRVVRGPLPVRINAHQAFILQGWSKGRLCQCQTLTHFDPGTNGWLPYYDFLQRPPRTHPDGRPDPHDPRFQASKVAPGAAEAPQWGAIALYDFPHVLVDGYLRSILFMRDGDRDATLPVWVGLGGSTWRVTANGLDA